MLIADAAPELLQALLTVASKVKAPKASLSSKNAPVAAFLPAALLSAQNYFVGVAGATGSGKLAPAALVI